MLRSRPPISVALALALVLALPTTARAEGPVRLTLAEAVARALEANPDARSIEARVARQAADVRIALAGVLPAAAVSGVYTHHDQGVQLGGSTVVRQDDVTLSGEVSVALLRPAALGGYLASRGGLAATRSTAEFDRRALALATVELYLGALRAAALAESAAETVARREAFVAAAERRADLGVTDRSEVQRARLSLLEARSERVRLEADRDVARVALAVMLALPPDTPLALADDLRTADVTAAAPPADDRVVRRAIDRRLDLRALRQWIERDETARTWAWLDFLPDLELALGFSQGPATFRDPDGFAWQVQLRAVFTLYDGGARYGRLDRTAATLALDRAALASAEDAVGREVRTALLRVAQRGIELRTAGESAALAAQVRRDVQRRLEAGIGTVLDVLDAEDRLAQAELRVRSLAYDLRTARWQLARASGTLMEAFER